LTAKQKLFKCLRFISISIIDESILHEAYRVCQLIDEKDTLFVALALSFQCKLLTGDKKLRKGLERNGYHLGISVEKLRATLSRR
jgi:predicted nucleic acid-binding protein